MERIVDRSREFLGPADMDIVTTRKLLGEAGNTVSDGGPLGLLLSYYNIRSEQNTVPYGSNWNDVLMNKMYPPQVE